MFLAGLVLTLTALSGTLGQEITFQNGLSSSQTCGVSEFSDWASDGSVTLTSADLIGFQSKVVVVATQDVCTVDLAECPPEQLPTSAQSCFCKSRQDDLYNIHVGSRISNPHSGMTLKAVLPGRGPLKNIFAAATIGKVPNMTDNLRRVNASYKMDAGASHDLLDSQHVTVCPGSQPVLDICVHDGSLDAYLTINQDNKTTMVTGDRCITHTVTSGQDRTIKFQYKEEGRCTSVFYIYMKEDDKACVHPTTTSTTSATTAPLEIQVEGVCPNTPRTVRTLPSGLQVLTDDVTFNTSWIVVQRRVSSDLGFYRPWVEYVAGFGAITDSFWLGLENIHQLCNSQSRCELLINIQYEDQRHHSTVPRREDGCYFARYSNFSLTGADDKYRLTVNGYTGNAGDSFKFISNVNEQLDQQQFSTFDQDNDQWIGNCALKRHGAWWHRSCTTSNLNAGWGQNPCGVREAIEWYTLTYRRPVTFVEMKVRRLI